MDHNRDAALVIRKSFQKLSDEFNYDCKTFWNKVPKACVLIEDQHTIATASKNLIAGLFLKVCYRKIVSVALDLSFYAKCSPTDGFLYDKVSRFVTRVKECQPGEVIVKFKVRGWYENWMEKSPKTGMEKDFFDFLNESENDATVCFFGPWLATILLRFNRKPPSEVATRIINFFRHEELSFWKEEFSKKWTLLLEHFPRVQLYAPKKDALYRAMIETSFVFYNRRAYDLMKFTTLHSIQFTDMLLVKMIDTFLRERPLLKLFQIEKATRTSRTARSWDAYLDFRTYFRGGLSKDEQNYAKYAREFNSEIFINLSYASNPILCNYLAIITDYDKKSKCSSAANTTSSYVKLISNRNNVEPMTNEDYRFCANAAIHLLVMESETQNRGAVAQNCKRSSEQKKLVDEAKQPAQIFETRLMKLRKLAKNYATKYQEGEPVEE